MDGHISNSDDAEMNRARNSEMKIIDENPYDNTFRASVNGCKKCQGNGIVFPKRSNEPEICSIHLFSVAFPSVVDAMMKTRRASYVEAKNVDTKCMLRVIPLTIVSPSLYLY